MIDIYNIYILTKEYNDYDQHGDYFVAVFINKPTCKEISSLFPSWSDEFIVHILNGGG